MQAKRLNNRAIGAIGETLAVDYLNQLGYRHLHRNWRSGRCEVDLISIRDGILHFFEVKTRRTLRFGWPEEHIGMKKIDRMMKAAEAFLRYTTEIQPVQLNIVSIVLTGRQPPILYLFEDISTF
jgi:putative endonuclease